MVGALGAARRASYACAARAFQVQKAYSHSRAFLPGKAVSMLLDDHQVVHDANKVTLSLMRQVPVVQISLPGPTPDSPINILMNRGTFERLQTGLITLQGNNPELHARALQDSVSTPVEFTHEEVDQLLAYQLHTSDMPVSIFCRYIQQAQDSGFEGELPEMDYPDMQGVKSFLLDLNDSVQNQLMLCGLLLTRLSGFKVLTPSQSYQLRRQGFVDKAGTLDPHLQVLAGTSLYPERRPDSFWEVSLNEGQTQRLKEMPEPAYRTFLVKLYMVAHGQPVVFNLDEHAVFEDFFRDKTRFREMGVCKALRDNWRMRSYVEDL